MTIVQKTLEEHVIEALGNFLEDLKGKDDLNKLLEIYIRQVEDAERVAFELFEERVLDTAVGAQLDGIGRIIGEERQGKDDAEYRIALATRIDLNNSTGIREDILKMILGVLGDSTSVDIDEYYPASFVARVLTSVPDGFDPTQLATLVQGAKSAGVNGQVTYAVAGPFQFDTGLGFDEGKYGGVS